MIGGIQDVDSTYKDKYIQDNYFRYKPWVYRPFIKALVRKTGLRKGAHILDAGCGQGYFTHLLAELGFNMLGVDLSAEGIASAIKDYEREGVAFKVGDVLALQYPEYFDCVFARGCSLYNSLEFSNNREPTRTLLSYVKPGGCLIFNYHTNLSPRKHAKTWVYHSFADVTSHFSPWLSAEVYFSLKIETILLGKWAFSEPLTLVNKTISRSLKVGGEAIAIVVKQAPKNPGDL